MLFSETYRTTSGLSRFAERVWMGKQATLAGVPASDPSNRFMSGLPAHLLAQALELGSGAYCLDAACASSLYAIKLACHELQDGKADVMLAGAVNRADDLFIHVGFTALKALSKRGESRPFHPEADGLIPADGAGFVVLKRLKDAEAAGDKILGVIRGVGVSNDGRGNGFWHLQVPGKCRPWNRLMPCRAFVPMRFRWWNATQRAPRWAMPLSCKAWMLCSKTALSCISVRLSRTWATPSRRLVLLAS